MTAVELDPIVMIPARLGSTRLPDKVLADIHGTPLIVHVLRRAEAARIGPVVVACAEPAVADVIKAAGGTAILTDPDLPSGSDRIAAALAQGRSLHLLSLSLLAQLEGRRLLEAEEPGRED